MAPTASRNTATTTEAARRRSNGSVGNAELGSEGMGAARAWLDIPGTYTRDILRLTEESMRRREQTLEKMLGSLRNALHDSRSARDLQELAAIEWRLVGEQVANCMQSSPIEFNGWLVAAAKSLQSMPLLTQENALRCSLLPKIDPEADAQTPLALWEHARSAWSQYLQQWASTVRNGVIPS